MAKYRVDTDKGSYEVETADAAPVPGMEKLGGTPPGIPKIKGSQFPDGMRPGPNQVGRESNITDGGGGGNGPQIPAIVSRGLHQLARAIPSFSTSAKRGTSDLIEGTAKTLSPLAIPALVSAPIPVLGAAAVSTGAQQGGEYVAGRLGADEDTKRLVGNGLGLFGGFAGSRLPNTSPARFGSALWEAGKAGVKATPILGKAGKAFAQDLEKTAPDYVDPKVTRQAELTAQAGERAKARVQGTAEAKAKLKADAEAKIKADADAAKVADAEKARALAARVEATPGGPPEIPAQPPLPEVTPTPPADGRSPSGRLYGPREQQPLTPTPPPQRTALWQGNQSQPVAPPMTPQQPATGQLPSGRVPGTGEPAAAQPAPPVRTPLWQRSAPVPNAPIEMTPQQPPTPRAPRVVRDAPQQPAPQPSPPAVAPQPTPPAATPPVAAANGPSAPEGSAVIPPVAGRPNRYGDMGGKLGEQVARDAHAKDTAVAKYLTEIKVTQGQFRAADAAQKAKWAREANPKYKGYTDPDRIDDLANLLQPDAGPTLYQGKQ